LLCELHKNAATNADTHAATAATNATAASPDVHVHSAPPYEKERVRGGSVWDWSIYFQK
jgi:hypothetical protein